MNQFDIVEALRGRIAQLEQERNELKQHFLSAQNIICLMVNKFGNPVIITTADMEAIQDGDLVVHTDPATGSIMITFTPETAVDSEAKQTQIPQGDGKGEGE